MQEYKGILRSEAPAWQGWAILDRYATVDAGVGSMTQLCENNVQLQELVAQFYQGGKK